MDAAGKTALMHAVRNDHKCIVEKLNNGADVNMVSRKRKTALTYAMSKKHDKIEELLRRFNAEDYTHWNKELPSCSTSCMTDDKGTQTDSESERETSITMSHV
ncbi:ankyrin, partial [Biomphalaria pfeifferi]